MLKTRVIPCLLLKDNGLVKTVKFKNPQYIGDPINAIKIFNEKEVDELILLDITASMEKRNPDLKIISQVASECFMPLSYGGGVRSIDNMKKIFNAGVEKIILNSYAGENPFFVKEASAFFGSQSIVAAVDVKKDIFGKYKAMVYGGKKTIKIDPVQFAVEMEKMGAGELFLNSIDRDGTMEGYDLDLVKKFSCAVKIPVIVCGGAGKIEDFHNAVSAGASAVAAGSMFIFHGKYKAVLINFPSQEGLQKI